MSKASRIFFKKLKIKFFDCLYCHIKNSQLIVTSLSQLSAAVTSINSKQMLSNNVIFHQKTMYVVRKISMHPLARAAQF